MWVFYPFLSLIFFNYCKDYLGYCIFWQNIRGCLETRAPVCRQQIKWSSLSKINLWLIFSSINIRVRKEKRVTAPSRKNSTAASICVYVYMAFTYRMCVCVCVLFDHNVCAAAVLSSLRAESTEARNGEQGE